MTDFLARWGAYQRERFPILAHGPLVLAFSLCAVCFSALLRGGGFPAWPTVVVAFVSSLISFLHLRLADEFKDFEDDARFRPYRPVPRGLVTLRQLGVLWVASGAVQLVLAIWLDARLLAPLLVTWGYLALMSREFFCRRWLKAHPFTYMWSHMFIMPLIDFYATACDWMVADGRPPGGLVWFVVVSFFNGFVIEIGRKIRAPKDEEVGVETYSALWGRSGALRAWWTALGLTAASAAVVAAWIGFLWPVVAALGVVFAAALGAGVRFLRTPRSGKIFEALAGVWTLVLYVSLGVVPMVWRLVT